MALNYMVYQYDGKQDRCCYDGYGWLGDRN